MESPPSPFAARLEGVFAGGGVEAVARAVEAGHTGMPREASLMEQPRLIMEALRGFASVLGVSAVLKGNVQVTSSLKTEDAQVFGINLDEHILVSKLEQVFGIIIQEQLVQAQQVILVLLYRVIAHLNMLFKLLVALIQLLVLPAY